jgi:hypothetical protein
MPIAKYLFSIFNVIISDVNIHSHVNMYHMACQTKTAKISSLCDEQNFFFFFFLIENCYENLF